MKRKIKITFLLLGSFLSIMCISCTRNYFTIITSGDFVYTTSSTAEGYCKIIGLSSEGREKEVIVFPSIIDGYKVAGIGAIGGHGCNRGHRSGDFIITNTQKIYFTSSYSFDYNQHFGISFQLLSSDLKVDFYIPSLIEKNADYFYGNAENLYDGVYYGANKIYTNGSFYDEYHEEYELEQANVIYYVDNEVYFVDDCDGTVVNVNPPTPYKEGYNFVGWYKDRGCVVEWDFENNKIPSKIYDVEGNYVYKETSIYAKWEKA